MDSVDIVFIFLQFVGKQFIIVSLRRSIIIVQVILALIQEGAVDVSLLLLLDSQSFCIELVVTLIPSGMSVISGIVVFIIGISC